MSVSAVSAGATYQPPSSTSTDGSSRGNAMKALVDGINGGDAAAAKQALAKLRDDRTNAAGTGGQAQGAQDASLTYSPSASTAQTTTPGSTIDVTA